MPVALAARQIGCEYVSNRTVFLNGAVVNRVTITRSLYPEVERRFFPDWPLTALLSPRAYRGGSKMLLQGFLYLSCPVFSLPWAQYLEDDGTWKLSKLKPKSATFALG